MKLHKLARPITLLLGAFFDGEYAEFLPAYTQILSDPAGNLWLTQWKPPFSNSSREFHVYSSRGRRLGRIKLPAMSMIAFFGPDHIGLIQSDADGIQYLRTYVVSPRLADPGR